MVKEIRALWGCVKNLGQFNSIESEEAIAFGRLIGAYSFPNNLGGRASDFHSKVRA